MFVLDCLVTMAWFFEDEATNYTQAILDTLAIVTLEFKISQKIHI